MASRSWLLSFLPLLLAECGSDQPRSKTPPSSSPAASAVVAPAPEGLPLGTIQVSVPEQFTVTVGSESATSHFPDAITLTLARDGSFSARGKPAGRIVGFDVRDVDGKTLATVGQDGSITLPGEPIAFKLDEHDDLHVSGILSPQEKAGEVILSVTTNGRLECAASPAALGAWCHERAWYGKASVTGVTPATKRTAMVLSLVAIALAHPGPLQTHCGFGDCRGPLGGQRRMNP